MTNLTADQLERIIAAAFARAVAKHHWEKDHA